MDDAWQLLRITNIALAVTCLAGMVFRRSWWRQQEGTVRLLLLALAALVAAAGYSTLELALHRPPPDGGPRLVVVTVALTWVLVALHVVHRTHRPPRGPHEAHRPG